jgi:hypothetical protein
VGAQSWPQRTGPSRRTARRSAGVAAQFVANGTRQSHPDPDPPAVAFEPELQNDPNLRHAARSTVERWREVTRVRDSLADDERILRDLRPISSS